MTTENHLLSKTNIFDPLFHYFITVYNCDSQPDCPQAQQYAMCKYSFNKNKIEGSIDTDICDEFTRNVLAFGKHLQFFDVPTYQGSLIKPIEENLISIITKGIQNAVLEIEPKSERILVNSNGRIMIQVSVINEINNLFEEIIKKNIDLSDEQKIVLENLNKILVNYFNKPLVILSSDRGQDISSIKYNIEASNMTEVIYGNLNKIKSNLSGPIGPLYILKTNEEITYDELLRKLNILPTILYIIWNNLFRKPVGTIFDRPSKITSQQTKDALKLLNKNQIDGIEKILLDKYIDILDVNGKIRTNMNEIDINTDRINLKQEMYQISDDKVMRIPSILKLLPILSEETKAIIVNGKRILTNDKYILLKLATYANRKDIDSINEINKLLNNKKIVSMDDDWYKITNMENLVFNIDMNNYINEQLNKIDIEESTIDKTTLEELSNKFRKVNNNYQINKDGSWTLIDNKYITEGSKCYTTGLNVDKNNCKVFIQKLLEGEIESEILNMVGEVSVQDVRDTHPKLAIKLLKQLGFKKTFDKETNLWFVQSVEYVLNKKDTRLNKMKDTINSNAKNYLSLLVKLINSNDIYNNPVEIKKVEQSDILRVSTEPIPEIFQKLNIKRHTPINNKIQNLNWNIITKNPYKKLLTPSLSDTHSSFGVGFGLSPMIYSGLNPKTSTMTGGDKYKFNGEVSNNIFDMLRIDINELYAYEEIDHDTFINIMEKIKHFDNLEYELFNTLRTYSRFNHLINSNIDLPHGHKTKEQMEQLVDKWEKLSYTYNDNTSQIAELIDLLKNKLNTNHDL